MINIIYTVCSNCGREIEKGSKCVCGIDKERYKRYNKYVRWNKDNVLYSKFYSSVEWKRLSNYIRSKYNNMCLMCLLENKEINVADVTHHLREIRTKEGWVKRLDENNLIPLCHGCHNKLHSNYTEDKIELLSSLIKKYKEEF